MFDHEQLKVYFRGEFVDFSKANISIANSGFLYGLGIFTGIRAHFNQARQQLYIFRPEAHFERFSFGCKLFRYKGFTDNFDYPKFRKLLVDLLQLNKIKEDAYIRVTNFTDENRITPKFRDYKDSLCAFLYPLGDYVPTGGMRCKVSSWVRAEDNAIPARAKVNGIYVNTAFAKTEALLGGFDEAIVLDKNGHVVEGSAENIFLVIDGKLVTPPVTDNILEGITRRSVIQIAKDLGIEVVERSVDRTELYKAEEIFLSGTGAKISPVVEVDNYTVGKGTIGPVSTRVQEVYFRAVKGEDEKYMGWLTSVY